MTGVRSRHTRGRTRESSDAKDNQDHSNAVAQQYAGVQGGDLCRENLVLLLCPEPGTVEKLWSPEGNSQGTLSFYRVGKNWSTP